MTTCNWKMPTCTWKMTTCNWGVPTCNWEMPTCNMQLGWHELGYTHGWRRAACNLAGMSKAGVLRATGDAMSTPVVATAFKRCMKVLAARMSMGVPSTIPAARRGAAEAPNGNQAHAGAHPVAGGPGVRAETDEPAGVRSESSDCRRHSPARGE